MLHLSGPLDPDAMLGCADVNSKHLKRHTRPYGCTFKDCPRRFGSKNDWKRHENTMHCQIETWKCAEPKAEDGAHSITNRGDDSATNGTKSLKQCGLLRYRRELFMAHLHKDHGLTGAEHEQHVEEQCERRRVGRNGQCGFWCGFCQTIVKLGKLGTEAWDERFNHIDDEHFKKGTRVEDWVPLDGEVPRVVPELAPVGDPDKAAREAEAKGSDEEDSGPDTEGEGEVVALEAGGLEDQTTMVRVAAVAKAPCLPKVAVSEARAKVRRLWDCVGFLPSYLLSSFPADEAC